MSKSTMTIDEEDTRRWKNEAGDLHREDGPAVEHAGGSKEWLQNGRLHRINGPAVEWANGIKLWFQNGIRHRLDGPAVEWDDGTVIWYIGGDHLGSNINGFWRHWDRLNDEERQNVNLHMWLRKLTND